VNRDELFLPQGYSENQPEPVGTEDGLDYWAREAEVRARSARRYQDPVYRFAARIAASSAELVLDIGCGTGENLMDRVAGGVARTVGVDQPSAIALAQSEFPEGEWIAGDLRSDDLWRSLSAYSPAVTICADVVEHVEDPLFLLEGLRSLLDRDATLVLSTPDRSRLDDQSALGPPKNPHHIREWTQPEMTRLLQSRGFAIRSSRHVLPRKYSFTWLEAKMLAWRALHLKAVPGRRSCMVFELARA
jgi:trans-aconitate methyltransferase